MRMRRLVAVGLAVVGLLAGGGASAARTQAASSALRLDARSVVPGQALRISGKQVRGARAVVMVGSRRALVIDRGRRRVTVLVPALTPELHTVVVRVGRRRLTGRVTVRAGFSGRVRPQLETLLARSSVIGEAGGSVSARASDGTGYELSVPPGALATATSISLTPVKSLGGWPDKGPVKMVQFGPDGLEFAKPATLRITLPPRISGRLVGVSYRGDGTRLAFHPVQRDGGVMTLSVEHFSGEGVMEATLTNFLRLLAELAGEPVLTVEEADDFFATKVAADSFFGRGWCLTDSTCRYVQYKALDAYARDMQRACRGQLASTVAPLAEVIRRVLAMEANAQAAGRRIADAQSCRRRVTEHMVGLVTRPAQEDPLGVPGACANVAGDFDRDGQTRGVECAILVAGIASKQAFTDLQGTAQTAALAGLQKVIKDGKDKCDAPATQPEGMRMLRLGSSTAAPHALLTGEFNLALEYCVKITVTPGTATIETGKTADFTAQGKDPADDTFTWTVSPHDAASIDANGHLIAAEKPGTFQIIATSTRHQDRAGSATVTVTCPAGRFAFQGQCKEVRITIDPTSLTLEPGHSTRFTATVHDTDDTRVEWHASGGTILDGRYTAPREGGTFKITAFSVRDRSKTATATVSVPGKYDLDVQVVEPSDPLPVGDDGDYVIEISNHGPATAESVMLDVVVRGPEIDCDGTGSRELSLGDLASGASATHPLPLSCGEEATLEIEADVSADRPQDDRDPSNNSDSETTRVAWPPGTVRIVNQQSSARADYGVLVHGQRAGAEDRFAAAGLGFDVAANSAETGCRGAFAKADGSGQATVTDGHLSASMSATASAAIWSVETDKPECREPTAGAHGGLSVEFSVLDGPVLFQCEGSGSAHGSMAVTRKGSGENSWDCGSGVSRVLEPGGYLLLLRVSCRESRQDDDPSSTECEGPFSGTASTSPRP